MFDLAIIGGGPAGVAAGVYASRKHLKTIFVTDDWGGQSNVSGEIQNWIGEISITGADFAHKLKEHLKAYAGTFITISEGEKAVAITKIGDLFSIQTNKNTYTAKTILITAGAARKKLPVPGAAEFDQKGLTYCASCDGPLFADMDTAVVGGGNAAFDTASQLLAYAKSVTLLHHSAEFKADPSTVEKVLSSPKMKALWSVEPLEVKGKQFVTSLVYLDKETNEKHELPVAGIFVEIGMLPNTSFVKDLVKLDQYNRVVVDPRTQRTSIEGAWAAGDCTNGLYHQNNISAGDAVKALEDIYGYLSMR
ncbi:hypothetical protein A2761_00750 [Candidatus Kaiserbacteria bacterium RIFCSPHIGHO2_01_FULL_51_33]|nr:MAG: hypothetical protein A2761_00750 [Candidatus Kaiserbacteria bacterium RIFCSPHIGHO2_01_FULL_51_33]